MLAIIGCGIYTIIILSGIYYYEDKLRDLREAIEDYKRALKISKRPSDDHYAYLQLENQKLKQDMQYLSDANDHLQAENKSLRIDNQDLKAGTYGRFKGYSIGVNHPIAMPYAERVDNFKDMQYESSVWKSSQWESYYNYNQDELDLEQ